MSRRFWPEIENEIETTRSAFMRMRTTQGRAAVRPTAEIAIAFARITRNAQKLLCLLVVGLHCMQAAQQINSFRYHLNLSSVTKRTIKNKNIHTIKTANWIVERGARTAEWYWQWHKKCFWRIFVHLLVPRRQHHRYQPLLIAVVGVDSCIFCIF